MFHMAIDPESPLLSASEGPAARVLNARGVGAAVLVCEHASRFIPASLEGLGLEDEAAGSHAAWDVGAMELAVELMGALDAPLVHSRVSRLVYDCNRPPEATGAVLARSERFEIPGNQGLSAAHHAQRVRDVYAPFRDLLADAVAGRNDPPLMITIHSFTPVYNGIHRDIDLGILHDTDNRAARALLGKVSPCGLRVALNQPYSARDGVTHTLREHGVRNGLHNVMLEVRNDLIDTPTGVNRIAGLLSPMLAELVADLTPEAASS
ncbi:N-formylglutamate amidohydrolase [Ruegeria sp. 2205SS24-7]|uniref:N-formylglutamate amidohydrolase n=1 Tax=Ruegeria discodermiae TaxID=3064389 RepID=UPI0027421754|nr:N-formylglutamate amidohydrolase [Ruegeria sp. 2205SS24-7]MDP5216530.1 N-formylglutamate amidohydrolase [Ruegeria sp. 2205SS24-7]